MPKWYESIFGSGPKYRKRSNFNAGQERNFNRSLDNPIEQNALYGAGQSYLQRLLSGDPQMMQQMQAPFMENFEQNIVPGIAERFAGMGTGGGAMSSSGLNNSLAQAGRSLQSDLAAMQMQFQMQGLPQALAFAQQPYSNVIAQSQINPFQLLERPGMSGLLHEAAVAGAGAAGQAAGASGMGDVTQNRWTGSNAVGAGQYQRRYPGSAGAGAYPGGGPGARGNMGPGIRAGY